ncbi:Annexin A7 [Apiospora rasikravindrae]|uniref:Annexin A7 n=1 Tax=Apiospora rasikravindrae TaxID=990691 RepID=A0ABR1RQ14_9PEZI
MSLRVDDSGRSGRSRSPGRRDDERDRSRGRAPAHDPIIMDAVRMPSPPTGFRYDDMEMRAPRRSEYDLDDRHASYRVTSPTDESYYRQSRESVDVHNQYSHYTRRIDTDPYSGTRPDKDRDSDKEKHRLTEALGSAAAFLPAKYSQKLDSLVTRDSDSDKELKKKMKKEKLEEDLAYGTASTMPGNFSTDDTPTTPSIHFSYANTPKWEYDATDTKPSYAAREGQYDPVAHDQKIRGRSPSPNPDFLSSSTLSSASKHRSRNSWSGENPRYSGANVLTVEPGRRDRSHSRTRSHSPQPPTARMSSLSVNTGFATASHLSLSNAPASPLLESYHGTYQTMSPMPSPLLLASRGPSGSPIEPLSPGYSDDERGEKKKRRARFNDPVDDASTLAKALKGDRRPDTEPLIEILPAMTHSQVMNLRIEYKRLVKTGSERKGVNIAKHIRARLKDEDPLLMKACYTCALGQWEGEAYWANFWYQGDKTRRELLIESIMGRTNHEIRQIKDGFSDKKYRDSLSQCMKTELKEDKFKKAVLMVLEERRMEEYDEYGRPLPVDRHLVEDDVHDLRKAVKSEKGGETAMIQIVIMRSDSHLRDVLKMYERTYKSNFARDALKKSGNLVGELLAHILNGVINKPVRDALLLNHALTSSKKDGLRRELLISRLVRYHWDRHHMAAVKRAYRERYGQDLSDAIRDGTSGEWGLFCRQLAVTRMPDDVRQFEKVEVVRR